MAAPLCSRHLADLGADVIKVERPDGGDFARDLDTAIDGQSANFVWLNYGKRSVCIDLRSESGRATMWRLLDEADVFLHNLGPGAVDRLGFGYDAVAARNPSVVWCSISGYGADGPYRLRKGFDLLIQGEVGLLDVTGSPEARAKVGIAIADNCAGIYAFGAVVALLYEREVRGIGGRIDISLFDCLAEWMSYPALLAAAGRPPRRAGARHAGIVPYGPYRCGDGRDVSLAVQNDGQWRRLALAVDREAWLADPRFATVESRAEHRDVLEPLLEEALAAYDAESVTRRLEAADIPVALVNDLGAFLHHPQLVERDRWVACETTDGPVRVVQHPFNIQGLERAPGRVPSLGEQTDEILGAGPGWPTREPTPS